MMLLGRFTDLQDEVHRVTALEKRLFGSSTHEACSILT
jgi:hypothetical protein